MTLVRTLSKNTLYDPNIKIKPPPIVIDEEYKFEKKLLPTMRILLEMKKETSRIFLLLCIFIIITLLLLQLGPNRIHETVLVTGGLGFIGSNLVDELISEGYKVVVFDDESTGHNYNSKTTLVIGTITKPEDLDQITQKIDYVIHFAAAISVAESMKDPEKYERINKEGSRNVIEWAIKKNVRRIVAASSASVYGEPKTVPISENSPKSPISPYASTKYEMEHIFRNYNEKYGITAICLRFFNVYGPRQNPKSAYSGVISKFIDLSSSGQSITVNGDGKNTRDFVFVKDIARANIMAMKRGKGFRIYNVGTGVPITITDLALAINNATRSEMPIVYRDAAAGDIKDSLSNATLIQKELGWKPIYSLEDGLRRTLEWYKSTHSPTSL